MKRLKTYQKFYESIGSPLLDLSNNVDNHLISKIQKSVKPADSILEIFRKRENLDVFNKKALYIYIREMIDVKTPKITKIADKLGDIFKNHYLFYLENGYTNF